MRGIEKANPDTLYGIFGDAQWTNKDRLSDALLRDLIEHFSRIDLGNQAVAADILGQAYEYLIKKFADAHQQEGRRVLHPALGRAADGQHPRPARRARRSTTRPAAPAACCSRPSTTSAKPAATTGSLWGKLFGQEKNLTTSAIARMNLFLHGAEDFQIVRGDTLRQPAFFAGDRLATFDCVIANPPFSLEEVGRGGLGERSASGATSPACRRARAATTPGCST